MAGPRGRFNFKGGLTVRPRSSPGQATPPKKRKTDSKSTAASPSRSVVIDLGSDSSDAKGPPRKKLKSNASSNARIPKCSPNLPEEESKLDPSRHSPPAESSQKSSHALDVEDLVTISSDSADEELMQLAEEEGSDSDLPSESSDPPEETFPIKVPTSPRLPPRNEREERWEEIKSILYTRPLTESAARIAEFGGIAVEEDALVKDLQRKDENFAILLKSILTKNADSAQLKYFYELLQKQYNELMKRISTEKFTDRSISWDCKGGYGADWAHAATHDDQEIHPQHLKGVISPFDAAQYIRDITWTIKFVGTDVRARLARNARVLSQHVESLEAENQKLKDEIIVLKGGTVKPKYVLPVGKFGESSHWVRMKWSEDVCKLISDPLGYGKPIYDDDHYWGLGTKMLKNPTSPAEAAHPWFLNKSAGIATRFNHPKALFMLWEGSLGEEAFYAPAVKWHSNNEPNPTMPLLTEEDRRKALYMHCNHQFRKNSPFIMASSSLAYVSSVWQYRLRANYLLQHVSPVLFLSVISVAARLLDSHPILKFTDELAYYNISHPEMSIPCNGSPAFSTEYLLPYIVKSSHVVGTYKLDGIMATQQRWKMVEEIRQKGNGAKSTRPVVVGKFMTDAKERDEQCLQRWYDKKIEKQVDAFNTMAWHPEWQKAGEFKRDRDLEADKNRDVIRY
ncbi:hypothetical protein EJ05DRAFT_475726 [Pseudovirgaria hyperparasitica]|uniref:Uncharacterized protein n=1 Tax=Pseudovirgaria hyperparasitica TaxID=470096 RepID=A0A6A6W659_9PEZI|nr:uncharacterized protein EJ05DRAFT_475726 [Pseudovirgaria hyperparasitica]KAF2758408.1 hypothetical protein EJ05DRAFT_475726 [Pseudovirgaria hyperparasitica]